MGKILVDFDMTDAPYALINVTKESTLKVHGTVTYIPSGKEHESNWYKKDLGAKELTYDRACEAVASMRDKLIRQVRKSACYFIMNQDTATFEKHFGTTAPTSVSPAEVFNDVGEAVEDLIGQIENTATWFTHKFLKWDSYDVEEQVGLLRSLYRANEIANSGNFFVKLPGFLQLAMQEAFYGEVEE
jgi:hypothetical protein